MKLTLDLMLECKAGPTKMWAALRRFPWVGLGLTQKHYTRLELLARDKHASLLRTLVNYCRKMFYNIDTWLSSILSHSLSLFYSLKHTFSQILSRTHFLTVSLFPFSLHSHFFQLSWKKFLLTFRFHFYQSLFKSAAKTAQNSGQ